jgi:hypothetical protein
MLNETTMDAEQIGVEHRMERNCHRTKRTCRWTELERTLDENWTDVQLQHWTDVKYDVNRTSIASASNATSGDVAASNYCDVTT